MKMKTVREAINEAFSEEMRLDPNVILMGCDVGVRGGAFGVSIGLADEFGLDRVIDTPISEAGFTGIGVGAAATGLRPVVEIMFCDWITLASDQIINMAAKMRYMFGGNVEMPLVIRVPFGAGGGQAAQHSQSLESWFNHIPGLKIVAPAFPEDYKSLLKAAIRDNNPVLYFEHKTNYAQKGYVGGIDDVAEIGKARVCREGTDVTIVSYSQMVFKALEAAEILEKEGISVEVIDLRSLLPLDYDTVMASLSKTNRIVVAHEAQVRGGIGSDIVSEIIDRGFDLLDAPPKRVGALNVPVPYNEGLEKVCIPSANSIVAAVKETLSNN